MTQPGATKAMPAGATNLKEQQPLEIQHCRDFLFQALAALKFSTRGESTLAAWTLVAWLPLQYTGCETQIAQGEHGGTAKTGMAFKSGILPQDQSGWLQNPVCSMSVAIETYHLSERPASCKHVFL